MIFHKTSHLPINGWRITTSTLESGCFILRSSPVGCSKRDQIFLFGFSRGAYTARVLAGMIECVRGLNLSHFVLHPKYFMVRGGGTGTSSIRRPFSTQAQPAATVTGGSRDGERQTLSGSRHSVRNHNSLYTRRMHEPYETGDWGISRGSIQVVNHYTVVIRTAYNGSVNARERSSGSEKRTDPYEWTQSVITTFDLTIIKKKSIGYSL